MDEQNDATDAEISTTPQEKDQAESESPINLPPKINEELEIIEAEKESVRIDIINVDDMKETKEDVDKKSEPEKSFTIFDFEPVLYFFKISPMVFDDRYYQDHVFGVIWLLFSKQQKKFPNIPQLHCCLKFLQELKNNDGSYTDDVNLCIQTVQDNLIKQYVKLGILLKSTNENKQKDKQLVLNEQDLIILEKENDILPQKIVHDNSEEIRDNPGKIHDNPGEIHDNFGKIHDNLGEIHDNPEEINDGPEEKHNNPEEIRNNPEEIHNNPEEIDNNQKEIRDGETKEETHVDKTEELIVISENIKSFDDNKNISNENVNKDFIKSTESNPNGNPNENPNGNPNGNPNENPIENPIENPTGNPNRNPIGDPIGNPNIDFRLCGTSCEKEILLNGDESKITSLIYTEMLLRGPLPCIEQMNDKYNISVETRISLGSLKRFMEEFNLPEESLATMNKKQLINFFNNVRKKYMETLKEQVDKIYNLENIMKDIDKQSFKAYITNDLIKRLNKLEDTDKENNM
ncbi:hypothetical protein HZH68_015378 [Vespula germanica]|uniref:Uncharacterized protein n=1 Tax=Vespula germanica TaxID=30212 RepID=A0A834MSW8_VESGE|nr:hypothetical protein HZH68_015378 [Vespula germanica]